MKREQIALETSIALTRMIQRECPEDIPAQLAALKLAETALLNELRAAEMRPICEQADRLISNVLSVPAPRRAQA